MKHFFKAASTLTSLWIFLFPYVLVTYRHQDLVRLQSVGEAVNSEPLWQPHQQNIYLCHIRASPTANGCQAVYKWQRRSCIKHRGCSCSCQQTVTSSVWMEKEPEVYSEDSGSDPLQSSRMHSPTGWLNIKRQIKINPFNYTTCDQFKLHLHLYLNMF